MTTDPRSTYSQLLEERRHTIAQLQQQHRSFGYAKLAMAALGAVLVWLALAHGAFSIAWVLVPIAVFAVLVVAHERVIRVTERVRRATQYFETALARLDGDWTGAGEPGDRYIDPEHTYAQDLDLFGKGSLFQLLCTARTRIGQDTLAGWLRTPADPAAVRARQAAVTELRPRVDLREELAVLGEDARTGVDAAGLAAWGEAPVRLRDRAFRISLHLHTALGIAGFIALWMHLLVLGSVIELSEAADAIARDVFLVTLVINGWFLFRWRMPVGEVAAAVEEAAGELRLLSEVLVRIEREKFQSPLLAAVRASLDSAGAPPSKSLFRLWRLVEYLDSRDNVFVRVLQPFLLWTPHLALKVEEWRAQSGPVVRRWLNAAGDVEALCSLASHAYEHPTDTFPEFTPEPARSAPCLEAEAIGHPLLPEDRVVRNDIRIGGALRLYVVSGSNMSGKSTMLRTLGVNTVLAQAGSVVRARSMRLSPLMVGASIRVSDSLQGGVSRFYAEILRLRQILDLTAGPLPVLFLIDEFLHGTNSHDRRIGAEALVKRLVERGAIGLITTHDLALADIADTLGESAVNVHFEDRIADGKILFDYRMQPGVVRKSNAIELMRQVGLEI